MKSNGIAVRPRFISLILLLALCTIISYSCRRNYPKYQAKATTLETTAKALSSEISSNLSTGSTLVIKAEKSGIQWNKCNTNIDIGIQFIRDSNIDSGVAISIKVIVKNKTDHSMRLHSASDSLFQISFRGEENENIRTRREWSWNNNLGAIKSNGRIWSEHYCIFDSRSFSNIKYIYAQAVLSAILRLRVTAPRKHIVSSNIKLPSPELKVCLEGR